MIALIDSGAGNLRSVEKALQAVGAEVVVTSHPESILRASKAVLPGVGAFGDCVDQIRRLGLENIILDIARRGTPLLGICVGMQVLFDVGEEMGTYAGLGLLPGIVKCFPPSGLKVPQTGWNQINSVRENPLLAGLPPGSYAFFNHSYYCNAGDPADVLATTEYGLIYPSAVARGNIFGVQFHPEKSQAVGLHILKNFVEL